MKQPTNPCIKTLGWWIFKYKAVVHTWKVNYITKFMDSSDSFHVHRICEKCGVTDVERFVEMDDLILKGYPADKLEAIGWRNKYYYPNEE